MFEGWTILSDGSSSGFRGGFVGIDVFDFDEDFLSKGGWRWERWLRVGRWWIDEVSLERRFDDLDHDFLLRGACMDFQTDDHGQIARGGEILLELERTFFPDRTCCTYLVMNALSLITIHTSLKGTSLVSVWPCKTLGSALVMVDAEVHGVGMPTDSSFPFSSFAASSAASSFECRNRSRAS